MKVAVSITGVIDADLPLRYLRYMLEGAVSKRLSHIASVWDAGADCPLPLDITVRDEYSRSDLIVRVTELGQTKSLQLLD
jgi:hypothetical protein